MLAKLASLRPRSIYDVMALIACVAAVGTGTAYAADTIGSSDIIDESILSQDIKNQEVRASDIHDGGVTNEKLQANSVTSGKVADESLTSDDLATNSVGPTEVADDAIDGGEIVNDSLGAIDLAPNAAGASEIAANAVTGAKVASQSLTTADILGAETNGAISLSGIPNGRCTQVTFNVSGAAVGQSALVSTRAAIQNGIVLYPNRVASAGHVEVNACNFSGGAMTAISGFPIRVVTFG
jgi:hypothetical protein